jgi:hypothetical protein
MIRPGYYFDSDPCADIAALCARFTGKRLQSPYRSTVPLIDLVHHHPAEWNGLLASLGAPSNGAVHFEFGVPAPKPGGNPSQTDVLFTSEETVWAVEAKWTEPIDAQTVAKRLAKPESDGGDPHVTVSGWFSHLQRFTQLLHVDDFADIIYQMVHRAASAAYVAHERNLKPELVYLHFAPSPLRSSASTGHYVSELARLHGRLGRPRDFLFRVVEMVLEPTAEFEAIKNLDKHSRTTSQAVRAALCQGPLFNFGTPSVTPI